MTSKHKCTLSEEFLAIAKKELTEDPETRWYEVQVFRDRLLKVPGLKCNQSDTFLLMFLRARKFDQERAFTLINNYYKSKIENEDWFATLIPSNLTKIYNEGLVNLLPGRDKIGCPILCYRIAKWDPDRFNIWEVQKASFSVLRYLLLDERTQIVGVRIIIDMKGLGWNHVKQMTPSYLKFSMNLMQNAFPIRYKGMHHINESHIVDYVFAMAKPFMSEKFLSRMFFHGDKYDELLEFMDKDLLPEYLGGKSSEEDVNKFVKPICQQDALFKEETKYGFVSMTIKDKEKKKEDAMVGMTGAYKKLNVD